ncbi:MAG: DNA-binding response regulator [Planctomycetes bacterium]|nr:DNA-binding response regulator [Planctomycetota bacterium]
MPGAATERILIIEDEDLIRLSLRTRLEREGYQVDEAATGGDGLRLVEEEQPDLILLDYRLPDHDGLSILRELHGRHAAIVVILMTAYSTVTSVVEAMKLGAYTYLNKPFEMDELVVHVQKGLETTALRREVDALRRAQAGGDGPTLIAESPAMLEVLDTVKKVNRVGSTTILLRGENGTGKDLLAGVIHATSTRANCTFQNITCTALPDALLESELFGHEKGAFTDAKSRKQGLFELADGGTIFLDEIGDMSLPLQAKLLRFLEERAFRRVGGTEDIQVDVRIVAATNRDLETAVKDGAFRQDLFYRLSVIPIVVPPLQEREEDVHALARLFIARFNAEFKRSVIGIEDGARRCLESHSWPGNVRELRNVIERAMILGSGDLIEVSDLPPEVRGIDVGAVNPGGDAGVTGFRLPEGGLVFEEVEKDLVGQALDRTNNNQTRAARLLGMSRDQIRYRIEKFGLDLRTGEETPS